MDPAERTHASRMLVRARNGDQAAIADLLPLVYGELRTLAVQYLRRERGGHTLQPTALVNEAFLRLVDSEGLEQLDQAHFLAIAAKVMRRVLVEHARTKGAQKRGGEAQRVTLDVSLALQSNPQLEVLALDEALERLAALDARQARVVEMRFFGGLSVDEVAQVLGLSRRAVALDWTMARAFLRRELEKGAP